MNRQRTGGCAPHQAGHGGRDGGTAGGRDGGRYGRLLPWAAAALVLGGLLAGALSGCTDAPGTSSYVSRLTTGTRTTASTQPSDVDGAGWAEGFY